MGFLGYRCEIALGWFEVVLGVTAVDLNVSFLCTRSPSREGQGI